MLLILFALVAIAAAIPLAPTTELHEKSLQKRQFDPVTAIEVAVGVYAVIAEVGIGGDVIGDMVSADGALFGAFNGQPFVGLRVI